MCGTEIGSSLYNRGFLMCDSLCAVRLSNMTLQDSLLHRQFAEVNKKHSA
jgi:hypothetical protein